jgi:hypothetical protein
MFKTLLKNFFLIVLCGLAANAAAHRYFFSITNMSVNSNTQSLEIIHQLTAHDIDNVIAQEKQIHFSSGHPQYEEFVKEYIENHFQLVEKDVAITLNWVGLELGRGQLFIYQEIDFKKFISNLVVKNSILVDTYPKQVNTVNYRDIHIKGSLTFTRSVMINKIAENN